MKPGPVTKHKKTKKTMSNKLRMTSSRKVVTSFLVLQFMANLKQSRSRKPDALSVKVIFSLTVTFYLTKTENRTQNSLTQPSNIALNKSTIFVKKRWIFAKKCLKSAKLEKPCCWRVYFYKTTCVFVYTCQIWRF